MVNFPNIRRNWDVIAQRPVISNDDSHEALSLNGRMICLMHVAATPLKALSGLGNLALSVIGCAMIILSVLTLNADPENLNQAVANVIDITIGVPLLPGALLANVVRGVVGVIFHPGAMIREGEVYEKYTYPAIHNILYGTLVNY